MKEKRGKAIVKNGYVKMEVSSNREQRKDYDKKVLMIDNIGFAWQ